MMGELRGKQFQRSFSQGFSQYNLGVVRRAQVERHYRRLAFRPAGLIVAAGEADFQPAVEIGQARAVGEAQWHWAPPFTPFVELLRNPVTMLANQCFDFGKRRPVRCTNAQPAMIDGQADGAPPRAA